MKPEKMMDVIGQIDDALVEEFAQRRPPRFRVPWSLVATAACLCLVIASLVFLRSAGLLPVAPMPTDPTQTTTQPSETTMPTETTQPMENIVSTDWIIEEDTSITGEVIFAIPLRGQQGMNAMIAAFNEIYPNIKIMLHSYDNNGASAINAALLTGEVDVMTSVGLRATYKRCDNGLFYDLTKLVDQEKIDLAAQWGTDAYTYDGKIYTFPCGGVSNYIAINMNAWNEAGLGELPTEWTWDEYLDASRKMTKKDNTGKTVVYGGSDHHSLHSFLYAHCQVEGGDIYYDKDGTPAYDNPTVLAQLERKLKAELTDGIWYPLAQYRSESMQCQMLFCKGIVATTVISNITRFLHNTEVFPDVNWITGFAPYPTMEEGQVNYMSGVMPDIHAGINAYIEEEKLPAAWAFLKWFSTYGSKYLTVAGYQSTWRGTDNGELLPLIYGSGEEAAKWVDVESFERVVGRVDLPFAAETTITSYSDVSGALTDPMMKAINGETSAQECLRQALEEAEQAIKDNK